MVATQNLIDNNNRSAVLGTFVHEIAHAHQHARVAIDGRSHAGNWEDTPEGKAFIEARERDREEGNHTRYDSLPGFTSHLENAAETAAAYWSMDRWGGLFEKDLKKNAPHRYRWAAEWLSKK